MVAVAGSLGPREAAGGLKMGPGNPRVFAMPGAFGLPAPRKTP